MPDKQEKNNSSNITLSKPLLYLAEVLARKQYHSLMNKLPEHHDVRSGMLDDQSAASTDDISFERLPDERKEAAVTSARQILVHIIASGYRILEPEQQLTPNESGLETIDQAVHINSSSTVDHLVSIWHKRDYSLWRSQPQLYLLAGKRMLSAGEPLLAYDILSEGVEELGGDKALDRPGNKHHSLLISLLQQKALSLAQSGAHKEANRILQSLVQHGMDDSETMGILGRTWKDMAMYSKTEADRRKYLEESYHCYHSAYKASEKADDAEAAYYTGINAAAVSLFAGNPEQSRKIATRVENICKQILGQKEKNPEGASFWLHASLGEASLLRQDIEQAELWYQSAAKGCADDIRALGSMRKQARLILDHAGQDKTLLDHCFTIPSVILFSGHIIDSPDREDKRFPPENEDLVRLEIRQWLDKVNGKIGFSSAACGSDIIFLEEMLERQGEINIVLPFDRESFVRTSVDVVPDGQWTERFERILRKASELKILSQYNENTLDDDLLFTNLYLYGTAQVRAERAGTDLKTLLVWDGNKAKSIAGTAALAELIHHQGGRFDTIAPRDAAENDDIKIQPDNADTISLSDAEMSNRTPIMIGSRQAHHHAFLPLLIADVKGYSRLDKREKLYFASNFMGAMAEILQRFEDNILGRKTQGDSLFIVFRDLQTCISCAIALKDRTMDVDWTTMGISSQLTMRISLDAGPCYSYADPITSAMDFCGDYIVRAARLEPVTPPGNIYASETFVAVAKAYDIKDIQFEYAGQIELPKGYGKMQAFHLQ